MDKGNHSYSRREFLTNSCKVSAGLFTAGILSSCVSENKMASISATLKPIGANERINIAVIGARSRGWAVKDDFMSNPNIYLKAICDIDGNILEKRISEAEKKYGYKPDGYKDIRKMLEDREIDAVIVATPNHWHALATIWACQAGKHVYVEKPCCHNVFEGRKMVEAAHKYNRIVQVGLQNRSMKGVRDALEFLHSGGIGEIYMARGLCFKARDPIGLCKDGIGTGPDYKYFAFNSPGENYTAEYISRVDYEMWTGPAPVRPFNYNRFHYNWHWNWAYGSGDIGNQGPHQLDIARWGLGKDEHPVEISSAGNLSGPKSDQETPNTQTANFKYADGKLLVFEVRGLYTNDEKGVAMGNFFYGTKGWMWIDGPKWATFFGRKNEPGPGSGETNEKEADPMNASGSGSGGHIYNFITALRSGKSSELNSEIESGFMSSALPALANIAYRTGRTLKFDRAKERFANDSQANELLTRNYRKPYIVTEKV